MFSYCWLILRENFQITKGQPKVLPLEHSSGYQEKISFCGECGTRIYKEFDRDQDKSFIIVLAGSLDQLDVATQKPDVELWVESKAAWLAAIPGVQQFDQFNP
jgi:hypothetical protein